VFADDDAPMPEEVAEESRAGGEQAERSRKTLQPMLSLPRAKTGRELVAVLRSSPFVGVDLSIERDRSTGRLVDLG